MGILTEEQQATAKELANKIGELLGDAEQMVTVCGMALSLATAQLIVDGVDAEDRDEMRKYITTITDRAVKFLSEKEKETLN